MKKATLVVGLIVLSLHSYCQEKKRKNVPSKLTATMTESHKKFPALDQSAMDKSIRPQDNLYNYVNGTWQKTVQIPSDYPSWGSFSLLLDKTDDASLKILDQILIRTYQKGGEGQKIKDIYEGYINMEQRNANGIQPIQPYLEEIEVIRNLQDLQRYLINATQANDNPLYMWSVYADLKSSNDNAVYLAEADLGLGRDYYQKENERNTEVLKRYQQHLTNLLKAIGEDQAEKKAEAVLAFEKRLASYYIPVEKIRDAELQYNPKTQDELKVLVKSIDLPYYLTQVGANTRRVIIGELKYYENLDQILAETPIETIKAYMKARFTSNASKYLNQEMDDLNFEFYGTFLNGQKTQRPIKKRAQQMINNTLGEAFGKLYVEEYFKPEAKTKMIELIDYLKKSFILHIDNLQWMSETTKIKAKEKLNKFTVKVGYPDKWKDYSQMEIMSIEEGGNIFDNIQQVGAWQYQDNLNKVDEKVDRSEWHMSPQTVNAYYNPTKNEIVFPAAILQSPFFSFEADPAFNFGGIGAVIGHEMTHGFDDSGAKFDGDGNLVNWWTEEDLKNFENITNQLAEQYAAYEPVKGTFINGKLTNGENIADLGGINIAFDALQMYLKDHGDPEPIDGYNQNQRFYLSWATVWRTKSTDQYLQNQVKGDPHSPGYFRAIGPVGNAESFYEAFNVKEGDGMYKTPLPE